MRNGIVYVAWGIEHINEAVQSAATVKDYPTCLITDTPELVPAGAFGEVIVDDFSAFAAHGPMYRKHVAMKRSPFEVSCFLDTDTRIMGDISFGFRQALKFEFATVIAPGFTLHDPKGQELCHYNAGVLFFRGHPNHWVDRVLKYSWVSPCEEHAWSIAFDELNINPFVLPFNFNVMMAGYIHSRNVRIWHSVQPPQKHIVSVFQNPFDIVC